MEKHEKHTAIRPVLVFAKNKKDPVPLFQNLHTIYKYIYMFDYCSDWLMSSRAELRANSLSWLKNQKQSSPVKEKSTKIYTAFCKRRKGGKTVAFCLLKGASKFKTTLFFRFVFGGEILCRRVNGATSASQHKIGRKKKHIVEEKIQN